MKKRILAFLLFLALLCPGSRALAAATVTGAITTDGTNPVKQSMVYLINTVGLCQYQHYTTTDDNGIYTFSNIDADSYGLGVVPNASVDGQTYAIQTYYDQQNSMCSATVFDVPATGTVTINMLVAIGGKLSGKIKNACGQPVAASVWCSSNNPSSSGYMSGTASADGTYTTSAGQAGTYVCSSYYNGVSYYYNGVTQQAQATPITITVGATVPNIDFTFPTCASTGSNVVVVPLNTCN